MRPKWHFVLKAILIGVGIFIFVLFLLFIASLIIFILHDNGTWFVPAFGMRGIGRFFISIPWLLVLSAVVFIGILEVLVRKYSFAYRKPLLYSVIGIVLFVVIGGALVFSTRVHDQFSRFAREKQLPFAAPLYQEFRAQRPADVYPGTVKEITKDGFLVENKSNETFRVIVTHATRFPFGSEIVAGDEVVVMGDFKDGVIYAFGVRKIGEEVPFPRQQMEFQRMK